jgi:acyl-coenzyme A synthetase/AMP-(fatty) acid ligase
MLVITVLVAVFVVILVFALTSLAQQMAYVQLKPGTAVTEAELIEHAARTIREKAAIPKRVKISSNLPTTAVGKLFKPALVECQIEETSPRLAK